MTKKYDAPWLYDVFSWIFMSSGFSWKEWRSLSIPPHPVSSSEVSK